MFTKLAAISTPEIPNVHGLWCERLTSQGAAESRDATDAPSPASTSREGNAQHSNVPRDVNNEK
jgi:hypothetical protein